MTYADMSLLCAVIERIPCELACATYDSAQHGSAWLECENCVRCRALHALQTKFPSTASDMLAGLLHRPLNGGYELRDDLRKERRIAELPPHVGGSTISEEKRAG